MRRRRGAVSDVPSAGGRSADSAATSSGVGLSYGFVTSKSSSGSMVLSTARIPDVPDDAGAPRRAVRGSEAGAPSIGVTLMSGDEGALGTTRDGSTSGGGETSSEGFTAEAGAAAAGGGGGTLPGDLAPLDGR